MEEINIARIDISKAEEFFELYKGVAESDFDKWSSESKNRWYSEDYSLEYWRSLLVDGKLPIFIAFKNNKMIGYVMFEGINFGVGYLGWIGVLKEYQGKGIGKRLMETAEEWARKNGVHKLELETQEPELKTFYEKQGFELEGVRKNSWQHLDNYMFGKTL